MDPVTAAGLALGVASIGLQVYTGCIQGIQLLVTALDFPEDCKYLNIRLRMEQQRLFAWSETSGLLDLDVKDSKKVLKSNTFILHRQTILDLLVQVQCLFKEFKEQQERYKLLQTTNDQDDVLEKPEKDAAEANFPLPARRRDFIKKAMHSLKETSKEAAARLRWVSFDKAAFEGLLSRFSLLNDNMTDILDARLQVEIHHTVQDTNRGVLQLHHKIADLGRLVMALNVKLEASRAAPTLQMSVAQKHANADGLQLLSQLAKFKAFNESIESEKKTPWDEATAMCLGLGNPDDQKHLMFDRSMIQLDPAAAESDLPRCEAILNLPGGVRKKVWIEWKDYDRGRPGDVSPPKEVIMDRVRKLAALLNHTPKPDAFRTPHCLGFFDKASPSAEGAGNDDDDEDILNLRLGLVFERPQDDDLHTSLPPVSLRDLLQEKHKPRVTDRIKLAHAISNCLLYLHAVNWLHKGLRSHNIVFFRTKSGHVDYSKPYLSGFDFSRPARPDEMTDIPGDDAEHNLYRHPHAQSTNPGMTRERFKKSFDIYSLGVVFVEIAHWATIDEILKIDLNAARGRPSFALRVREKLLAEDQIMALGVCMGQVYEDATRKCIAGGQELGLSDTDDETNDMIAARLSMVFYEDVVQRLGEVRV
ncbi:prion-inhibition and propagation-domain-containing protein [Diplogelasinospora grovesii]|uniref:Prion-inhibition and propagation-domain-containing protein n=1 Tax=Diplogelasinospora grovesii TaxID=303347 RepID=A0AAN6N4N3_9PEZI|nr:prion-inhibition and propagation-domain-containing protein [Diplogelasinospora grovesii]